jgi:hypothetical protein
MQKKDTKGLNLSPILESFQQNPISPGRFIRGCPGSCTYVLRRDFCETNGIQMTNMIIFIMDHIIRTWPPSKIPGLISLRYAVVQIPSIRTVRRLVKLKIAVIVVAYTCD